MEASGLESSGETESSTGPESSLGAGVEDPGQNQSQKEDPRGDLWGGGGGRPHIGSPPCKKGVDPDERVVPPH